MNNSESSFEHIIAKLDEIHREAAKTIALEVAAEFSDRIDATAEQVATAAKKIDQEVAELSRGARGTVARQLLEGIATIVDDIDRGAISEIDHLKIDLKRLLGLCNVEPYQTSCGRAYDEQLHSVSEIVAVDHRSRHRTIVAVRGTGWKLLDHDVLLVKPQVVVSWDPAVEQPPDIISPGNNDPEKLDNSVGGVP